MDVSRYLTWPVNTVPFQFHKTTIRRSAWVKATYSWPLQKLIEVLLAALHPVVAALTIPFGARELIEGLLAAVTAVAAVDEPAAEAGAAIANDTPRRSRHAATFAGMIPAARVTMDRNIRVQPFFLCSSSVLPVCRVRTVLQGVRRVPTQPFVHLVHPPKSVPVTNGASVVI